jgi:transposase
MDYEATIKEKIEELTCLEKTTKDLKGRDRVRFLRLLKSGEASSQLQAGRMIGLKLRQSQRLWQRYQKLGIEEFIKSRYEGRQSKLSEAEKAILEDRLKKDDVQSLQQAQEYLAQKFGVDYTIGGVSNLFQQMKIKLKTGRPRNYRQDKAETEDFKKNAGLG